MATPTPAPRVRKDAARNRDALTRAASLAFREEGLDVPVDEIARRAGLGVATLYRHFPTKVELIVAVTDTVFADLEAAAAAALEDPDRSAALRAFLRAVIRQQHDNRGLMEALVQYDLPDATRLAMTDRVVTLMEPIADAAHAAGTLHPDLDAHDLLAVMRMLGASQQTARPRAAERYLEILLGGLAAPARDR